MTYSKLSARASRFALTGLFDPIPARDQNPVQASEPASIVWLVRKVADAGAGSAKGREGAEISVSVSSSSDYSLAA